MSFGLGPTSDRSIGRKPSASAGGWVEVCDLSLLLPGEVLRFEHRGKSYAVYGTQIGQLFASENKCTHGNAELADGFLQGSCIECPRHNGRFDIRTGAVLRPRRVLL
ncbi:MAG: non-heme iron oxygenase ferredoxin subunit [Candidatus Roseilinea sp.]|uniref:non-heme iron oxygenase ferredoxin subunit n=1 Tax=Candidatus Roseilinea sp. TaxID=2838777 RepID=UPI00404B3481